MPCDKHAAKNNIRARLPTSLISGWRKIAIALIDLTSTSRQRDERVQLHKDARRFSNVCSRTEVVGEPTMCVVRCSRAKLVISHARAEPNWSAARKRPMCNHPRQSPTIHPSLSYFPVFSSPTATLEVVGNTGNMSSEKAGVGGSTPSLATKYPQVNCLCGFLNSHL